MYDVVVIGAGPSGMSASLYLKRAGKNVLLLDKDAPGGQMLKAHLIKNYLGYESISGPDLAYKMFSQIKKNNIEFNRLKVDSIKQNNNYFIVNENIKCKKIIIATGKTSNKLKKFNNLDNVSYCAVCDGALYKDKDVAVIGDEQSAIKSAIYLSNICKKVYVILKNKIQDDKIFDKLNSNIKIIEEKEVINFDKDIMLNDNTKIKVSCLFISVESHPLLDFISQLEMEKGHIKVDQNMETSIKGIYATGDVIYKKYYQISNAVSEGMIAAFHIGEELCNK